MIEYGAEDEYVPQEDTVASRQIQYGYRERDDLHQSHTSILLVDRGLWLPSKHSQSLSVVTADGDYLRIRMTDAPVSSPW
jgi:hypothetical protein